MVSFPKPILALALGCWHCHLGKGKLAVKPCGWIAGFLLRESHCAFSLGQLRRGPNFQLNSPQQTQQVVWAGTCQNPLSPPQGAKGGWEEADKQRFPFCLELHFNYRSGQPTIALDRAAANRWEPLLGYWHVISVVNAPSHYSVLFGRTKKGI